MMAVIAAIAFTAAIPIASAIAWKPTYKQRWYQGPYCSNGKAKNMALDISAMKDHHVHTALDIQEQYGKTWVF